MRRGTGGQNYLGTRSHIGIIFYVYRMTQPTNRFGKVDNFGLKLQRYSADLRLMAARGLPIDWCHMRWGFYEAQGSTSRTV
jgi:hypothetical protein